MTASSRPAVPAAPRITSLSKAFRRQPKVMMSRPGIASQAEPGRSNQPSKASAAGPVIIDVTGLALVVLAP